MAQQTKRTTASEFEVGKEGKRKSPQPLWLGTLES